MKAATSIPNARPVNPVVIELGKVPPVAARWLVKGDKGYITHMPEGEFNSLVAVYFPARHAHFWLPIDTIGFFTYQKFKGDRRIGS